MTFNEENRLHALLGDRMQRLDSTRLSRLLTASFPCTLGRVDWRKARNVVERPAPPARAHGANVSEDGFQSLAYVSEVLAFLFECLARHGITDEWVAFVGDGMDAEYVVHRSAIRELLTEVAEIPDHKYVFGLDGAWCLMWSFEDDLYFGLRPG